MQYNNTKDTEKLLKIFYSDEYGFEEEELSKSLKEVVKYYDKHTRHQYLLFLDLLMKECRKVKML